MTQTVDGLSQGGIATLSVLNLLVNLAVVFLVARISVAALPLNMPENESLLGMMSRPAGTIGKVTLYLLYSLIMVCFKLRDIN